MLYELKRLFGREVLDLADDDPAFAVDTPVYAGQLVSTTAGTATYIDFEAANQQFPDNNTLELWCREAATSDGDATLAIVLQSSADAETWRDELTLNFALADIVLSTSTPLRRFTLPAGCGQYLRLKLTVGTAVFTAGQLFIPVRPL
jgi:hypothetical protein